MYTMAQKSYVQLAQPHRVHTVALRAQLLLVMVIRLLIFLGLVMGKSLQLQAMIQSVVISILTVALGLVTAKIIGAKNSTYLFAEASLKEIGAR